MSEWQGNLVKAVQSIADVTEKSFSQSVLLPLFVGFFGAYAAYIFATRQANLAEKKRKKSRLAVELLELIKQLQDNSVDYWCTDYSDQLKTKLEVKEAQIHAGIMLAQSMSEELTFTDMTNGERIELQAALKEFISVAYDEITGGGFETASRTASKTRVKRIVNLCINARANVSRHC